MWDEGFGCCVGIVDVGNLGIQNAVDELFVFPIRFLFIDFPGMSKTLGIGNRGCLSFKETTKFCCSSEEPCALGGRWVKLNGCNKRVGGIVVEKVVVVGVKGERRSVVELNNPIFSRSNPEGNLISRVGVDIAKGVGTR